MIRLRVIRVIRVSDLPKLREREVRWASVQSVQVAETRRSLFLCTVSGERVGEVAAHRVGTWHANLRTSQDESACISVPVTVQLDVQQRRTG